MALTARQAQYREYLHSPLACPALAAQSARQAPAKDCLKRGRITRHGLQIASQRRNKGGSLEGELFDTVTLCADCHAKRHGKAARND